MGAKSLLLLQLLSYQLSYSHNKDDTISWLSYH